jgi:exosome complex component RRP40
VILIDKGDYFFLPVALITSKTAHLLGLCVDNILYITISTQALFNRRFNQAQPPPGMVTMSKPSILLPGDQVPSDALPSTTTNPLRLGSGVRLLYKSHNPKASSSSNSHQIVATQAGLLSTDAKRNTVTIQTFPSRRYIPTVNDLVIAQVHRSSQDFHHCIISPHAPFAVLGQLAFEGASKKTRPNLKQGDLVYARVLSVGVGAGTEVELTCVNPATGKAEPGGLGPLTGGMVFDVSTGLAARLMKAGEAASVVVLEELGKKLESKGGFEIAVGRNGRVWVDCSSNSDIGVRVTIALGQCLQELDRRNNLTAAEQRKLVSRILRELRIDV